MGDCWSGLTSKIRFCSTNSDTNNLLESDLDGYYDYDSSSESSLFSNSPCLNMTSLRQRLTACTASHDLQSVTKKIQSFQLRGRGSRESREKRLYRGAGSGGGNTEAKNFSIFDTPGSDSFNFGSHHDSLHDSQASLEWDPQDWNPRSDCNVLDNPLCEVKLDTANHQASFTYDSMHNVMQEVETDNMVRQIDNMAQATLRETNLWNIHVNMLETPEDTEKDQVSAGIELGENINKSTISTDTGSFSPMSTSLDSGNF